MLYSKEHLRDIVVALTGEYAELWWNSPNKAFNDRPPQELMDTNEWIVVRDYLMDHAYGGSYG